MSIIGRSGARFLGAAVTGLAMTLGLVASTPAVSETIKIGMILTYSGRDAAFGEQIDRAVNLFAKLHEKELPPGVKVELIKRDDRGVNPDLAQRLAQELVLRDKVQILTGGQWTPNAMAVAALTKQAKVPFVTMTGRRKRSDPAVALRRTHRLDAVADKLSSGRVGSVAP